MTTHVYATEDHTGRDGIRTVTIVCPHCGKEHRHGWPPGQQTIGARLSHCVKTAVMPYFIHPPRKPEERTP